MKTSMRKKNVELAAETKTIADYALVLEYCNGYERNECIKLARESVGEALFQRLLKRNIELFRTGDIVMMDHND